MKDGVKTSEGWTMWAAGACIVFLAIMSGRDLTAAHPAWGTAVTIAAIAALFLKSRGWTKERTKLKIAEALGVDIATVEDVVKKRLP